MDTLKLWLMWKAHGDKGLAARVDAMCDLCDYMAARLEDYRDAQGRRCFARAFPASFANLVFYLVPPSQRSTDDAAYAREALDLAALGTVAPVVKARLQRAGKAMIGFQPVKDAPNCWRMVFAGAKEATMTPAVVDQILDDLVSHAEDL